MKKNNNYEKTKKTFRLIGIPMIIIGLALIVTGMVDFFNALNSQDSPKLFFLLFIGLPLFGIGLVLTIISYADKFQKFALYQAAPAIKESMNYVMNNEYVCPKCGEKNEAGSKYCSKCGEPLKKLCPSCGEEIPSDSNYCNHCGKKIC